jgi:RAD51-like protein 3
MRLDSMDLAEKWLTVLSGAAPPIRTVEDLLNRYWESGLVDDLKRFGVTEEELETFVGTVSHKAGDATGITLEHEMQVKLHAGVVCSSGAPCIDELLMGQGFVSGEVTELVGLSGSGKTHLCMTAAAACASGGHSVLYLSSSNSFCHMHLSSMVKERVKNGLGSSDGADLEEKVRNMLSRIRLAPAFDVFTVLRLLESFNCELEAGSDASANLRLLVLDSVTALLGPLQSGQNGEYGRSLMLSLSMVLRQLARVHHVAVVVTNNLVADLSGSTSSGRWRDRATGGNSSGGNTSSNVNSCSVVIDDKSFKPALGPSWSSCSNVRLLVQAEYGMEAQLLHAVDSGSVKTTADDGPAPEMKKRFIEVLKSPRQAGGRFVEVKPSKEGAIDCWRAQQQEQDRQQHQLHHHSQKEQLQHYHRSSTGSVC